MSTTTAKKMTLAEATDEWVEATAAIQLLEAKRKVATEILKAHTEKTNRRTYFDRVAVERSGGSLVMDQDAVKERLGADTPYKRSKLGWTLKLLK